MSVWRGGEGSAHVYLCGGEREGTSVCQYERRGSSEGDCVCVCVSVRGEEGQVSAWVWEGEVGRVSAWVCEGDIYARIG